MTEGGGWTFSQNFSSLALTVLDLWFLEDLEEKDESVTELMSDKAVCRTLGLLIILEILFLNSKVVDFCVELVALKEYSKKLKIY